MKRCPNCSRAYSDMVTVCPTCHTSLSADAAGSSASGSNPVRKNSGSAQQSQVISIQQSSAAPANPVSAAGQTNIQQSGSTSKDSGSFVWALPGLFIPLAGIIVWACQKNTKPACAKMALNGAIAGLILWAILRVFI